MKRIEWTRKAAKQMLSLPQEVQMAVHRGLTAMLAEWPGAHNVKALTNREDYRLRIGRYRALFLVQPTGEVVIFKIVEVKKRDENTY